MYKNNNKLLESAERYMEPEIIIKRMVGECSSSVTDSTCKLYHSVQHLHPKFPEKSFSALFHNV